MYSGIYHKETVLTQSSIRSLYQEEVMDTVKPAAFMGIWQLHSLSTLLGCPIVSVYPGPENGSVTAVLNRNIYPVNGVKGSTGDIHIMWTSTHAYTENHKWFQPNHFIPLLPRNNISDYVCKM